MIWLLFTTAPFQTMPDFEHGLDFRSLDDAVAHVRRCLSAGYDRTGNWDLPGHGSRHVTARLPWPTGLTKAAMCRNIKTLFNFEPPATEAEIRDASLQFVRKICGFTSPSKVGELAFQCAVEEVTTSARALIRRRSVTTAQPRNREVEV